MLIRPYLRGLIGFGIAVVCAVCMAAPVAAQLRAAEDLRGRASEARFEDGRYRQAGIAFDVPADWTYLGTMPGGTPPDETASWVDSQTGISFYAWISKRKAAPENVPTMLANAVRNKTEQRAHQRYQRWRVRAESIRQTFIDGHPALAAIADFETKGTGKPRVELLTWIFTPESRAFFFAITSPEQLTTFQPTFDSIARSATLP